MIAKYLKTILACSLLCISSMANASLIEGRIDPADVIAEGIDLTPISGSLVLNWGGPIEWSGSYSLNNPSNIIMFDTLNVPFLHNLFIRLNSGSEIALGSSISATSFTNGDTVAFYTGDQQVDFIFFSVRSWANQSANWTPYVDLSLLIQNVQLGTYEEAISVEPPSVPEPATALLMTFGLLGLICSKFKKVQKS